MTAIAPYLKTPLPACSIIIDRHTHKNAGSSMRKIYRANDLFDDWLFWYYGPVQMDALSTNLAAVMSDAGRGAGTDGGPNNISSGRCLFRAPLRFILEHHYTRVATDTLVQNFGAAAPLQHVAGLCSCRIVLFTRLREPVQYYLSFYRWTVMWRQTINSTLHGRDMFDWAPPNLQSSILLDPVQRAAVPGAKALGAGARRPDAPRPQVPPHTPAAPPTPLSSPPACRSTRPSPSLPPSEPLTAAPREACSTSSM
jgi:hypothetical protein